VHEKRDQLTERASLLVQVMQWDDHDIFDGWGSYGEELRGCRDVLRWLM
jgi:hypothetical protein